MSEAGKSKLHTVQTNWDEIEQKIREHRLKRLKIIALIVGICAAVGIFYYVFMQYKSYKDYTVVDTVVRADTMATHFCEYKGNILKYSNDGASYTNAKNELIWNQTFNMQNPMVSICDTYVAFADRGGKEIYVLDTSGLQGTVKVNMPIAKMEIASQGTVAVMTEEAGTSYLSLYNKEGELLAEGAIHVETGGVPLDIAIAPNGENLGVAVLDISTGKANTTVYFYNFGAAGQNEVDHIVGTYSYEDAVIPDIAYVSNDRMLAFADHAVYSFAGSDAPKEDGNLQVAEEIMSIFYDNDYFGLVSTDGEDESSRNIKIYSSNCKEVETIHTEMSFVDVHFLDNHEICLRNEQQCSIYTLGGRRKFQYDFESSVYEILHTGGFRNYVFILDGKTEQARLKLFGDAGDKE